MKITTYVLGSFQTNCYLAESAGEAVLIDPAVYSEEIASYIKSSGLVLKYVLLTHSHFDHTMGAAEFCGQFEAPAAAGALELDSFSDPTANASSILGLIPGKTPSVSVGLSEGSLAEFGECDLRVIETPGHTAGGISFYTDGSLFSGDTLFRAGIGRTDLPGGSYNTIISSITDKLYLLPDDTKVYPGHGEPTEIGWEKRNNYYAKAND